MRACVDGGGVAAPEEASGLVIPWKLRAHVGWQPVWPFRPKDGLARTWAEDGAPVVPRCQNGWHLRAKGRQVGNSLVPKELMSEEERVIKAPDSAYS